MSLSFHVSGDNRASDKLTLEASFKMISISHLPLILLPVRGRILLLNSSHLPPRNRPVLQDDWDDEAPRPTKRMRLAGEDTEDTHTDVEGWTLSVALGEDLEDEEVEGCAMSPDGQRVAAVGVREGFWIWNAR